MTDTQPGRRPVILIGWEDRVRGGGRSFSGSFESSSRAETLALGRRLGGVLEAGSVVLLFGEMGSGKTVFAKGIGSALGIPEEEITSPSFTLMNTHEGRERMIHLDLYRVESFVDVEQAGLLDVFTADAIVVVEWPERLLDFCKGRAHLDVEISIAGPHLRRITISGL